jgi:hypothetical protein
MDADSHIQTEFEVEAALLINEGGVQCVPVVFARRRGKDDRIQLGERALLNGARVARLDPAYAMQRGPGLVAFVLEDPMDVRLFRPGDMASLRSDG